MADASSDDLDGRILLTLHLADRRGYGLSLPHFAKMLVRGKVSEEDAERELGSMPSVSHRDEVYCLKGREKLIPETKRRLLCNGMMGERYEALAQRFASEYASRCPFIRCIAIAGSVASGGFSEEDEYMAYELLRQKPIFGIDFYRKILAKNMWPKTYFPQIYYRDSCETNVRKTLTARILHFIYTNYVVSKLGGLYSSHTGITSKPSLCEVGD